VSVHLCNYIRPSSSDAPKRVWATKKLPRCTDICVTFVLAFTTPKPDRIPRLQHVLCTKYLPLRHRKLYLVSSPTPSASSLALALFLAIPRRPRHALGFGLKSPHRGIQQPPRLLCLADESEGSPWSSCPNTRALTLPSKAAGQATVRAGR
jgi:hypothetical protein